MKTLELKLKKDMLIVDTIDFILTEEMINNKVDNIILADYKFICKGSELTEEIASELVEDYSDVSDLFISCLDDLKKRIERCGFFWLENPYDKLINVNSDISSSMVRMVNRVKYKEQWQESEEKTFRNPLIFVKK